MTNTTHQGIREAIRARIVAGEWQLGELIPGEVEFAEEFGCSRTTVNRALQALAEEGIVERKRKGGTRVRPLPSPQAQFRIPVIREQVESRGREYGHRIVLRELRDPPGEMRTRLQIGSGRKAAYMESLHLAGKHPFAFERRWVNLATVPGFAEADLSELSANEWLIRTVPFSRGEVGLTATSADARLAAMLEVEPGEALFTMERTTWFEDRAVTAITLYYARGYRLEFGI
ncbi:GntR family transcriptional regulator [Erythrobacter mangrovi]|uniref:UTRA domain-containing protein n=1 Tax=Erythrobacter mangrovi TaxID=2739433 RepID=A0A7D4C624_9SPHN|nr:UTRA domain-containing protein [Erythrobacter mangrovi]QKG72225.1 UTRA domain-containing protein [Erythrobacter mangrovi]